MRSPFRLSFILLLTLLTLSVGTLVTSGTPQPALTQEVTDLERKAEADRLLQQGIQQVRAGQFRAALQSWETALSFYRAIEDLQGEAYSLNNLGNAYYSLGEYQRAIDYHEQRLALAYELEDLQGEAYSLNNLGNVYYSLGQYQQAINYYEQSLALAYELEDLQGEANSLNNLGNAYHSLGEYQRAIDYHEQSLALAYELEDLYGQGNSLGNLGIVYYSLRQYQQAINYHEQRLTLAYELEDLQGEAYSLNNLGLVYFALGQYQQAIDYYEQSLAIKRELEDRQGESSSLNNLGITYYSLGKYQQAIDYYEQSLAINYEIQDRQGEADSLNNLGLAYFSLGQHQQAIAYYEQSLTIKRELEDRQGEVDSLSNLGNAYDSLREYQRAIDYYEQSLSLTRELEDLQGEADLLGNLGITYYHLGQYQEAIDYHEQSLALSRQLEDPQGEGNALRNLGAALIDLGEFAAAEAMFSQALAVLDSLRTPELTDASKVAFFDTYLAVYKVLQQALVAQNSPEKTLTALEVAEQSRARSLAELLAVRLSAQQAENISATAPDLTEIRRIAQQQNATLVEYSVINVSEFNPALYIWVVQPTGEIHFAQVDLTTLDQSLTELVITSREAIGVSGRNSATVVPVLSSEAQQQRQAEQRQNLHQLHQLLIAPIAQWLPSNPEAPVIFVPQDDLFLVPFPALMDANETYLIEHHTILTAPSIQVLDLTRQQRSRLATLPQNSLNPLIVGNPVMPQVWNPTTNTQQQLSSLPGAEEEAIAIANALQTQPLLWDEATETTVKQQMSNTRIIHLATHGLLDYGNPQETGVRDFPGAIALTPSASDDGLLTAAEILEMNLNAELAVLSACDTGRGRITGDGVIGLSRSLISAGVPSVIVSLWSVSDRSTEYLMTHFYENLSHMNKAQALRQAMLTTMQQPEYSSPDSWAAFTLVGEAE
jgi:CHAT domain-containing protein/uncharacterized protein HemY